jgi:hypothetical protein
MSKKDVVVEKNYTANFIKVYSKRGSELFVNIYPISGKPYFELRKSTKEGKDFVLTYNKKYRNYEFDKNKPETLFAFAEELSKEIPNYITLSLVPETFREYELYKKLGKKKYKVIKDLEKTLGV